jgi:hypothetical protein
LVWCWGRGGETEDVAVKVFLGQGSRATFEAELKNLQTLTDKIRPARWWYGWWGWCSSRRSKGRCHGRSSLQGVSGPAC